MVSCEVIWCKIAMFYTRCNWIICLTEHIVNWFVIGSLFDCMPSVDGNRWWPVFNRFHSSECCMDLLIGLGSDLRGYLNGHIWWCHYFIPLVHHIIFYIYSLLSYFENSLLFTSEVRKVSYQVVMHLCFSLISNAN